MNVPLQAYWRLLARYLRPQRGKVTLLALLLFSGIAIQLVNPQIICYFIDTTQTSSAPEFLLMAALVYIVAAFVQQALTVGQRMLVKMWPCAAPISCAPTWWRIVWGWT